MRPCCLQWPGGRQKHRPPVSAEVVKQAEAWEAHQEELATNLVKYVRGLKKEDVQDKLLEVLECGPEWQWERFVRDYVER